MFQSAAGMRRQKVGVELVFYILIGMGMIEIAILIAFQVVSPLKWYREILGQVDGYVIESQGYCTSQQGWSFFLALCGFNVVCLLYAVVLSFQTKDIPSIFAEGKHIFLAAMLMFEVLILAIPLLALVRNDPTNFCFIRGMTIFLQNFTVLVAIFAPKMVMTYRGVDTDEAVKIAIAEGVARSRLSRNSTIHRPSAVSNVNSPLSVINSDASASMNVDELARWTPSTVSTGIKVDGIRSDRWVPSNVSASVIAEERLSEGRISLDGNEVVQEERRIPSESSDNITGDMYQ